MVHTTSAVAVAVLALGAASALAAPQSYEFSDEVAQRDFDYELDARDFIDTLVEDIDARDYDEFEVDARDFDDFDFEEARELLEEYDVDAREFDFGDFEERELFDAEDEMVERAPASTALPANVASSLSKIIPSATTTTLVTKPTGWFSKGKPDVKTVVVVKHTIPLKCKAERHGLFSKLKKAFSRKSSRRHLKHSQTRQARFQAALAAKASADASASGLPVPSTATATSTSPSATVSKSTTLTANWAQLTPPPRKYIAKGVKYSQKKTVGKDKVTTIKRTVTAAPSPCPTQDKNEKHAREIEEVEDVFSREYEFDELD